MSDKRVAVVTGANRGIGFEICRQLGSRGSIRVFLTARNESQGRAAAAKSRAEGLDVDFHVLDVTNAVWLATLPDGGAERRVFPGRKAIPW